MNLGVINQSVTEYFTVVDSNRNLIDNIDPLDFTAKVYNPNNVEVSGSVSGVFSNLGNGNYKYEFIPNLNGTWYVVAYNVTYFPWGKTGDVQVYNSDLSNIYDSVIRTLGLVHHNISIDQPIYDEFGNMISARVRIYSQTSSVGTDNDVIETYMIHADGTACGQFSYWQQTKI